MGFRDLFASEKGIIAVFVLLLAAVLVWVGKLPVAQWQDLTLWVVGMYMGAKAATGVAGIVTTKGVPAQTSADLVKNVVSDVKTALQQALVSVLTADTVANMPPVESIAAEAKVAVPAEKPAEVKVAVPAEKPVEAKPTETEKVKEETHA